MRSFDISFGNNLFFIGTAAALTTGFLAYKLISSKNTSISTPHDKSTCSFAESRLNVLQTVRFKRYISRENTIIFIHPPKTGGTNLSFIVEAISKTNPNFKNKRFSVPRVSKQSPNLITQNWIGGLGSAFEALKNNPGYCNDLNFISGHFPFGLHRHIGIRTRYIVLVRDPMERELSVINFDYQRGYINGDIAQDYLLNGGINNPQTRMLAGQEFMSGSCNEETIKQAKNNINEFFLLAGVTEDTNSFIQILASIQGWGPLAFSKSQVTGKKIFREIPLDIQKKLADKHSFDIQLYEWVKKRWYSWKEINIDLSCKLNTRMGVEKTLCITSDFANTKIPILLSIEEIEKYNNLMPNDLVEISQKHSTLDDKKNLSRRAKLYA